MRRPGAMLRTLSSGMRLCPPANNLALLACFDKASSAARKFGGLSYAKTGGFIALPSPVLIRCRSNDLVSGIVTQYDWSIRFWQESAAPRLRLAMRIGHQRARL